MTRIFQAAALAAVVWGAAGIAGAEEQPWWAKAVKGGEAKPAAATPAADPATAQAVERAKAMQEWQQKLVGSKWELEVTVSKPGQVQVVESDVLSFDNGSVSSNVLDKAGFERGSFSLYPPEGQGISWEAMQRKAGKDGEETAIWRAEVTGETMQGTLMKRHPGKDGAEGRMDQFAFTGKRMAPEPPVVPDPVGQAPDSISPGAPVDPLEPNAPAQP